MKIKGNNQQTSLKNRRKYTEDFQSEVLKMVVAGQPANQVAQLLGLSESLINKWKQRYSKPAVLVDQEPLVADVMQENISLQ
ncbi:MAG: transposase [Bacteroidota bacterium]